MKRHVPDGGSIGSRRLSAGGPSPTRSSLSRTRRRGRRRGERALTSLNKLSEQVIFGIVRGRAARPRRRARRRAGAVAHAAAERAAVGERLHRGPPLRPARLTAAARTACRPSRWPTPKRVPAASSNALRRAAARQGLLGRAAGRLARGTRRARRLPRPTMAAAEPRMPLSWMRPSEPRPFAQGDQGGGSSDLHVYIFVHGFHGNSYDRRALRMQLGVRSRPTPPPAVCRRPPPGECFVQPRPREKLGHPSPSCLQYVNGLRATLDHSRLPRRRSPAPSDGQDEHALPLLVRGVTPATRSFERARQESRARDPHFLHPVSPTPTNHGANGADTAHPTPNTADTLFHRRARGTRSRARPPHRTHATRPT